MATATDFTVNSSSLGTYYTPFGSTIAVLPDGTALVAWVKQVGQWSTEAEIQARWFRPDGTPAGDDFQINTTTTEFQWRPVAIVTAEGKVFLAWESGDGADGDGVGLRGVVLDPLSRTPSPDFLINPMAVGQGIYNGQNNQSQVTLTALSDGRVFAVWTSYDGSDGDSFAIRGRFFDGDGKALGDDFLVNSTSIGGQYDPQATELGDGRILLVYGSTDDADGTPGNIRARIIGSDGEFEGDDFLLNTTAGGYQSYVDVTTLADGSALVVWFSSGVFTPDPSGGNPTFAPGEVRARIVGADGQTLGPDFQINSTDLSTSYTKPVVTTLADGRVLVVWYSGDAGDGDWGCVRGRLIDANGQLIESDFVINTTDINNQSSPAVSALPDGRVLITWSSDNFDAMGAQVRGIYITPIVGQDGSGVLQGTADQNMMMGTAHDDSLHGGSGDDQLMGFAGHDSLFGGSGDDRLMGGSGNDMLTGGSGNDLMNGGTGDDTYIADGGDTIIEAAGSGTDHVHSSVTLTLGANLENLALTGTVAIDGTGNAAANEIVGNGADNILNGGGGNDSMAGGTGNDTYIIDGGDTITEGAGGGTDHVHSSVTLTLGANLENLTLTGTAAINGTGNSAANRIVGNGADNVLNGGAGADSMAGGAGNDTYITDGGDTITEAAVGGTDHVHSSVTLTLGANLENLTLTGAGAINGTGNMLANALVGNRGANTLSGDGGNDTIHGGGGRDILAGGVGNDSFIFSWTSDSATAATTSDVITDFVWGRDKIDLRAIDAFAGSQTNDAFIWNETSTFNNASNGEVRFQKFDNSGRSNDYTMVWIDNDNDAAVEMAIRLTGLFDLSASDFIL